MGVGKGWKGTPLERFWRKCEYDPVAGCVIWVGAHCGSGYGSFWDNAHGGVRNAHRWLWEYLVGPIAEGLELDHLCRVRSCVNLKHLEVVTPSENVLRGVSPQLARERGAAKTHCANGHEFTPENVWTDSDGWRHCRACNRDRARARRAAARAAA
jgi:hypothetical protein